MRKFLLGAIVLLALFDLVIAGQFLFAPVSTARGFGLTPLGPMGVAVLRADFTAFFVVGAAAMIVGALRGSGTMLLVAAALYAIALSGRIVTALLIGTQPGFWVPVAVEAVHVALLMSAWRTLPRLREGEIAL